MAERLLRIPRHQALELSLGLHVLPMRLAGLDEDAGEFHPRIGGAHIDNPNRLDAGLRRRDPEQVIRVRLRPILDERSRYG
jgi:hypothetical protein